MRDDLIKNTVYPDTTTPLSNPDNVDETNWQPASEVSDWSTIHSFKMELKDGVSWINGENITIQFAMKAPEFNEVRSEEHTSELQSRGHLVCRLLLEKR